MPLKMANGLRVTQPLLKTGADGSRVRCAVVGTGAVITASICDLLLLTLAAEPETAVLPKQSKGLVAERERVPTLQILLQLHAMQCCETTDSHIKF
jgi:hypothetical protein